MGELKECEHEGQTLKIALTEYAAKTDILHREQMSKRSLANDHSRPNTRIYQCQY